MTITVKPSDQGLGAEIEGVNFTHPIDDATKAELIDAFSEHHVLSFRGQVGLTTDHVLAASRVFDERLEAHAFTHFHHPDEPLIMVLSNRVEGGGKPKGMRDAGTFWHSDVAYKPKPAKATMLYSLEIPEEGGDTLFCNLTRAYEDLSPNMKDRLEGLKAWHYYAKLKRDVFESGKVTAPPECLHPMVRTNPISGRKAIYITPAYTTRIEGLPEGESNALMEEIFEHCLQDKYRMDYKWRAGDIVVWDNAAVMHSATTKDLDPTKYRTIWRTIISGDATY